MTFFYQWRNYNSYRTLQKHEVHDRNNTVVTLIIETYTVVVLLFSKYHISWFIKNHEYSIPNELQKYQSIVLCQVLKNELKKPQTNEDSLNHENLHT